jgi:flagellar biosynthetic protein FliP
LLAASLARGADAPPAANAPLAADGPPAAALDAEAFQGAIARTAPTVAIFAVASLVPAGVLMVTAFVRISIVLTLLRQALGSPQVPGNQVMMALALLLTALVMKPVADEVYARGIAPYAAGELPLPGAWEAATTPIKVFMVDQIVKTRHENYLWTLYDYTEPPTPGRTDPTRGEDFPLRVVAPAFLLSELTTALVIGFALYLPFLVIDLVVSSVLAAMGLFMLPPSMVALPIKLILFVLADGWMLVAGMLLRSFGT